VLLTLFEATSRKKKEPETHKPTNQPAVVSAANSLRVPALTGKVIANTHHDAGQIVLHESP